MFAGRYFAKRMFAARYFAPVDGGGSPIVDLYATLSGYGVLTIGGSLSRLRTLMGVGL